MHIQNTDSDVTKFVYTSTMLKQNNIYMWKFTLRVTMYIKN